MARLANKLTAKAAAALTKPGMHADGAGLYLSIDGAGRRRWVFLAISKGKRREMGLGGYPAVSLAGARDAAAKAREQVKAGVDPIKARIEASKASAGKPTFGQCADALIAAKESEWRSARHRAQWGTTLRELAAPLRDFPVDEVDTAAVLAVLQPLWQTIPETSARLRGRIEAVLDAARAADHTPADRLNPARWKGHLDKLLAKRKKMDRGHHEAMPFDDVPAFFARLREREVMAALALEFTILTAARSGEVLGARWAEVDFDKAVWTIPRSRMKAGKEHRVPLSGRALAIVKRLSEARRGDFIFAGQRAGKPLSPMSLANCLHRMEVGAATVHGFRSSFRDWVGEVTSFPREVVEAALAHAIGSAVEAAYRRGDALEKRRAMMEAWAGFCEPRNGSNVVPMVRSQ